MADTLDFLRQVYFLRDLDEQQLAEVHARCQTAHYPRNAVVFTEHARAERFFIVISGRVEVWKAYYSPSPDLLGAHGEGHLFGEMGLIDDTPRSATVVAAEDTWLLYMLRADFLELTRDSSAFARAVIRSLSAMIRTSNEAFVSDLRKRNTDLEKANAELRLAQQELLRSERLSNLGKFSSLILHDIRNPLSIMKGYTELIHMHAEDADKVRAYSNILLNETQRLNNLTNEFLDYSRGEIRLDLSVVDIGSIFSWLQDNIAKGFQDHHKTLVLENQVERPVLLDVHRMQRVCLNLAENARKAMDSGGELRICASNDSDYLYIDFRDTGVGMDEDTRQSIFEPFFSRSAKGGTGLGMVIVKSVVEAHSGRIQIDSSVGEGTSIRLSIPLLA